MQPTESASPADSFWSRLNEGDVVGAMALVADDAKVTITPVGVLGSKADAAEFFHHTLKAFPDVQFNVANSFTTVDGVTVTEVSMEGTQAHEYLGVINQEKHYDLDQVWLLQGDGTQISAVTGYWCQNQLYRRLAVKRTDQVTLV